MSVIEKLGYYSLSMFVGAGFTIAVYALHLLGKTQDQWFLAISGMVAITLLFISVAVNELETPSQKAGTYVGLMLFGVVVGGLSIILAF